MAYFQFLLQHNPGGGWKHHPLYQSQ